MKSVFGKSVLGGAALVLAMSLGAQAQGLPGVFGGQRQAPVVLAQAGGDQALDEQMRQLNGRMEDLNFQIMQLQEQIRKMQEDNEFRFQQLEGGGGSGGGGSGGGSGGGAEPEKQGSLEPAPKPQQDAAAAPAPAPASTETSAAPGVGEPPRDFGSITFDPQGNVVGGSVGDQATVGRDPKGTLAQSGLAEPDETIVAALPAADNPKTLYDASYKALINGDYRTAEAGFRKHTEAFPDDSRAADTQYWLGESLLGQQKFAPAVDVFAAGAKKFPEAKRAPEMMFKLGVSLASINRRDVACAAFKAVGERYLKAPAKLLQRAEAKYAESKC